MRVPEPLFGGGQRAEEPRGDHVFDAEEFGVGGGRGVEETLADVLCEIDSLVSGGFYLLRSTLGSGVGVSAWVGRADGAHLP